MTGDPNKPTVPQTQLDAHNDPPPAKLTLGENLKAMLPKNWQQIAFHMLTLILMAVAAKYGFPLVLPADQVPVPVWDATIECGPPAKDKAGMNMGVDWSKIKTRVCCCDPCDCCDCCGGRR